nr:MAG TPA: hypothetical protein [Bacteriophage sp.]
MLICLDGLKLQNRLIIIHIRYGLRMILMLLNYLIKFNLH